MILAKKIKVQVNSGHEQVFNNDAELKLTSLENDLMLELKCAPDNTYLNLNVYKL